MVNLNAADAKVSQKLPSHYEIEKYISVDPPCLINRCHLNSTLYNLIFYQAPSELDILQQFLQAEWSHHSLENHQIAPLSMILPGFSLSASQLFLRLNAS